MKKQYIWMIAAALGVTACYGMDSDEHRVALRFIRAAHPLSSMTEKLGTMLAEWNSTVSSLDHPKLKTFLIDQANALGIILELAHASSASPLADDVVGKIHALGEKSQRLVEAGRSSSVDIEDGRPSVEMHLGAHFNTYDLFDVFPVEGRLFKVEQVYALSDSPLRAQFINIWLQQFYTRFTSDVYSKYFPQIRTMIALHALKLITLLPRYDERAKHKLFILAVEAYLTEQGILNENKLEDGKRSGSYQPACDYSAWQDFYTVCFGVASTQIAAIQRQRAEEAAARKAAAAAKRAAASASSTSAADKHPRVVPVDHSKK